jgi:hypothetical protein
MTKLYFAGGENQSHLKELNRFKIKNILMTYFTIPPNNLPKTSANIFLDSGAYSAFTQKKEVNLTEYINFIKKYKNKLNCYASLDVIGDAEKTYSNFKIMKEAGLNPIPTFHRGEDFKWLEKYKDEPYIALGGMVGDTKKALMPWMKKCFHIIPKSCKVHGFGMTSPFLISRFPFYSIDSTSWLSGQKYGDFYYFIKGKIKNKKINRNSRPGTKDYMKINAWNLVQWNKYAEYLEEKNEIKRNRNK